MAKVKQSWDFAYTGALQKFTAEANHLYYLECYGASGGNGGGDGKGPDKDLGGKGGFAKGYFKSNSSANWEIQVGGRGSNGKSGTGGAGGYHGGGNGGGDGDTYDYETGGGGGGCTTIHQLLTAGGGSGGGSPNVSVQGLDVTELHDGKGCGGAGGAGYINTGQPGICINGGTAPSGGLGSSPVTPAQPGKNYIGGVTSGTHGTHSKIGDGSAKITCKAIKPTISVTSKTNTTVVVTVNYNCDVSVVKTVQAQINGTWTSIHSVDTAQTNDITVTCNVPANVDSTIVFRVNNGYFSTDLSVRYDNKPPVVSFPTDSYSTIWRRGETRVGFIGEDSNDTTLDYEVQLYLNDVMFHSYTTINNHVTPPNAFVETANEGEGTLYLKVRAKQSADTTNGTTQDIWSKWYTSPTVAFKDDIIQFPNFTSIKWYQDIEQQAIVCPYSDGLFETQHYCNGELHTTSLHSIGLTPPLLYTPIKPHLWSYEYYAITRVQNTNGEWSGWYQSPTVEVQFNVQPNDIEFSKELPPYFIQGEITTVEWGESIDPNDTKTTYTVSLMQDTTTELFEVVGVEEPRLTFTVPSDVVSNNITFSVVAYSDGLYSNPVSSPRMAITDVKIMDCTLDFPTLNTNVLGEFTELHLVINGDKKIVKTENFVDYTLPLYYFRSGANTLTLVAVDRNGVEVTRTWNINLDFNNTDLTPLDKVEVNGYMSFNHNEVEQYVPCTTLFKSNLDLGVVEHELYGSTTFEGANTVTQKLVIRRDINDDLTQLRTLKITGAIE